MIRTAILAALALSLAGCANITQQQAAVYAQAFCVVSSDGAVLAVALTKGGAQATAKNLSAQQPVVCDAATRLGAVIATAPAK